jgi:cysteinyl-tRNA synthetase
MATKYLGPTFDIHGGGLDLVFPHHENELAQSVAAGDGFARYWMHNGLVTMAGEKMSKSLGNTLQVREVVQQWRPPEVRYYLGAAHYRSAMEFSPAVLDDAAAAYRRIENFVDKAGDVVDAAPTVVPDAFARAMDDDLGVPAALAVLHETVRAGNIALADGAKETVREALGQVLAMAGVLGISPADWAAASSVDQSATIDGLVSVALQARTAARDRKDFAAADAIRDELAAAGVKIEDTPDGPRWSLQ